MSRPSIHSFAPALFFIFLLAEPAALAKPSEIVSFLDGDRTILAERIGSPSVNRRGRALQPVRLRVGAREVEASVDATAILRIEPGEEVALERNGLRVVEPLMPSIGLYLVEDTAGGDGLSIAAREARSVPNLYVRLEATSAPLYLPNDPRFSDQWFFDGDHLRMPEVWSAFRGSEETTIVVIDSGCDLQHPDLVDKLDPGLDVVDGDDDPSYDPSYSRAEHGTACAGLAAAKTNNALGIAGACPDCRIRCVRLLDDEPVALSAHIKAFNFALETGAAVVSNSWGPSKPMPVFAAMRDALENLHDHGRRGMGAVVMFSAGNDDRAIGDDELFGVRGVTTIGAVTQHDEGASYGNHGAAVDLAAPAGSVTTDIRGALGLDPGDYTAGFGGTSASCPVAAGIAALLTSALPRTRAPEIVDLMIRTARKTAGEEEDEAGHDERLGYGIIDPNHALEVGVPEDAARPTPTLDEDAPSASTAAGFGCSCSPSQPSSWAAAWVLLFGVGMGLRRYKRGVSSIDELSLPPAPRPTPAPLPREPRRRNRVGREWHDHGPLSRRPALRARRTLGAARR